MNYFVHFFRALPLALLFSILLVLPFISSVVNAASYSCSGGTLAINGVNLGSSTITGASNCAVTISSCSANSLTFGDASIVNMDLTINGLSCNSVLSGSHACLQFDGTLTGGGININGVTRTLSGSDGGATLEGGYVVYFRDSVSAVHTISISGVALTLNNIDGTASGKTGGTAAVLFLGAVSGSNTAGSSLTVSSSMITGAISVDNANSATVVRFASTVAQFETLEFADLSLGASGLSLTGTSGVTASLLATWGIVTLTGSSSSSITMRGGGAATSSVFTSSAGSSVVLMWALYESVGGVASIVVDDIDASGVTVSAATDGQFFAFAPMYSVATVSLVGAASLTVSSVRLGGQISFASATVCTCGPRIALLRAGSTITTLTVKDSVLDFSTGGGVASTSTVQNTHAFVLQLAGTATWAFTTTLVRNNTIRGTFTSSVVSTAISVLSVDSSSTLAVPSLSVDYNTITGVTATAAADVRVSIGYSALTSFKGNNAAGSVHNWNYNSITASSLSSSGAGATVSAIVVHATGGANEVEIIYVNGNTVTGLTLSATGSSSSTARAAVFASFDILQLIASTDSWFAMSGNNKLSSNTITSAGTAAVELVYSVGAISSICTIGIGTSEILNNNVDGGNIGRIAVFSPQSSIGLINTGLLSIDNVRVGGNLNTRHTGSTVHGVFVAIINDISGMLFLAVTDSSIEIPAGSSVSSSTAGATVRASVVYFTTTTSNPINNVQITGNSITGAFSSVYLTTVQIMGAAATITVPVLDVLSNTLDGITATSSSQVTVGIAYLSTITGSGLADSGFKFNTNVIKNCALVSTSSTNDVFVVQAATMNAMQYVEVSSNSILSNTLDAGTSFAVLQLIAVVSMAHINSAAAAFDMNSNDVSHNNVSAATANFILGSLSNSAPAGISTLSVNGMSVLNNTVLSAGPGYFGVLQARSGLNMAYTGSILLSSVRIGGGSVFIKRTSAAAFPPTSNEGLHAFLLATLTGITSLTVTHNVLDISFTSPSTSQPVVAALLSLPDAATIPTLLAHNNSATGTFSASADVSVSVARFASSVSATSLSFTSNTIINAGLEARSGGDASLFVVHFGGNAGVTSLLDVSNSEIHSAVTSTSGDACSGIVGFASAALLSGGASVTTTNAVVNVQMASFGPASNPLGADSILASCGASASTTTAPSCTPGQFHNTTSWLCEPCPVDTFSEFGNGTSCSSCAPSGLSTGGLTGQTSCLATTSTSTTTTLAPPAPPVTTRASPSSSSSSSSAADSAIELGPVVGGVCGGLVVIAVAIFIAWRAFGGRSGVDDGKDRKYDDDLKQQHHSPSAFDDEAHHRVSFDSPSSGRQISRGAAAITVPTAMTVGAAIAADTDSDRHSDRDEEMALASPATQTHRDLQASLRAAGLCAAAIVGDIRGSDAAADIKKVELAPSNSFVSSLAAGKMQKWTEILVDLNHDDVEELHDASTSMFWEGAIGLFEALGDAPTPIGECAGILGGIFSLAKNCLVNAYECQLLAQRCTRLLPLLVKAAEANLSSAQGVYAEMRVVLDLCFDLIEEFVPPKKAKDGEEEEWFGARAWKWLKHKSAFITNSADDFAECHMRLDRVIRETALALQLDTHAAILGVQRSVDEIKASVTDEVRQAVVQVQEQMAAALKSSNAETRKQILASQAELASTFAPVLNRIESKLDAMSHLFTKLVRQKREWRDLQVAPERVEIGDVELGKGGNGSVWLARFDHTFFVAAKTCGAADADEAQKVLREAKMMMSLRSPGIIQCFGVCSKAILAAPAAAAVSSSPTASPATKPKKVQRVFMLMERCLCNLQDISEAGASSPSMQRSCVASASPLSFSIVFHLFGSVASGLYELHQRGLVHRDIKPQNVMLSASTPPIAKLVDLGSVSKTADRLDAMRSQFTTLTQTETETSGVSLGSLGTTLAYCAPELLKDASAEPTPACDVYSLGISIFQLLTGESPSLGMNSDSLPEPFDGDWAAYVAQGAAQRRGAEAKWPRDVFDLVSRMIAGKPSRRMDIGEVIRRVVGLQDDFPLEEEESEWISRKARRISKIRQQRSVERERDAAEAAAASGSSGAGF